jgi:uncharacterized membrane protein
MRIPASLCRDRRGSVTLITAVSMLALIGSTALAVDVGSTYLADRRLQGVADAAALAAVDMPTNETGAAQQTATANGLTGGIVSSVTPGAYTPDGTITPAQRFTPNGAANNASRVVLTEDVPIYFGSVFTHKPTVRIQVAATATRVNYAAFSIGTRLASIQGGLPNALLSGLLGTNLNLSVMDYNALVGAHVNLLSFTQALATELDLTGASFGTTLATQVTLPQALNALAAATTDGSSATAFRNLALTVPSTTVRLSDLIDLGPYSNTDVPDPNTVITMNGYSIVQELVQLASGQRQVAINLGLSLPGITSTTLTVAIGQRPAHSPWLAVAKDGSVIVQTAQTRLYLDSKVGGAGTLGLVSLRIPLYIQLASGEAKLDSLTCAGGGTAPTATLDVLPSVGTIAIADLDMSNFSNFGASPTEKSAVIAQAPLVSVTGRADVALGGVTWQQVSFSPSDITAGTIKTVSTGDLTQGLATSLIGKINLQVSALGLGLNLSGMTAAVGALLTPLAPTLDALIDQLTALLGVHVGQADVMINGVRCGKPALVG